LAWVRGFWLGGSCLGGIVTAAKVAARAVKFKSLLILYRNDDIV